MYFPVAGIEVAWYIPVVATFSISFFASMGGFSGAFLILPFQVTFLGYIAPSVSATNQLYNLMVIPSTLLQYIREKRFYKQLCYDLAIGGIPGVLLGSFVRAFILNEHDTFRIYVASILTFLCIRMLKDCFSDSLSSERPKDPYSLKELETIDGRVRFSFDGKEYSYSRKNLLLMSCIVTFFGAIYGIGGGIFLAPFLLSYFKLPVFLTGAGMLFTTLVSGLIAVLFFVVSAILFPEDGLMPDLKLAAMLAVGGIFGMTLGTKLQKYMSARLLTFLVVILLGITAIVTIQPIISNYF